MISLLNNWQEEWLSYHKVTFDGINRLIIVNPGETSINIKNDVYSSWKEWARIRDHAKFLPALRTTGGDSIGGGQFTGDSYFLINNWRIFISTACDINGIIYSDNYPSPFVTQEGANIVRSTVSNLVQNLGFSGTIDADNEQIAGAVWDYLMSDANTPGSVGERLGKLLTVAKYLGLK
jgi:hypothetical protein